MSCSLSGAVKRLGHKYRVLLKEIFRTESVPTQGRTVFREAVRGIILNGQDVFMIHSPVNGDYKFPGGGVQ